ncbi:hypothetical protein [Aeoliella sp.]|uniref:hypothetical protein n=1 Tax=Aeoliella sp. TaxID=2795800 RepID=UPI003CCBD6ED
MGRKNPKVLLPTAGAAFAVPLEDGRYSVCRVLRRATPEETQWHGSESVLVATSAWIGDIVPAPQDVALRPILLKTHHNWENEPDVYWVSEPPPSDFLPIGIVEPSAEEVNLECDAFSGWLSAQIQSLAQWQWDNDRESVLEAGKLKAIKQQEERQRECEARKARLEATTLENLRNRQFFEHWDDYPAKKAILGSRQIMQETVEQLIELGTAATESARLAVLQECIERFNRLDEELDHFVLTIEREDICEEFEMLVHACGLGAHEDLADEWRDW